MCLCFGYRSINLIEVIDDLLLYLFTFMLNKADHFEFDAR
jgi:hypothetical protein